MNALGRHILVEFLGCSSEVLDDVSIIEKGMIEAAKDAGATVISSSFHHFSPYGVSGVVVIQESHLAIHTWPEYQYAAVDLFTCGDSVDPWISFDHLKKVFKAQTHSALEMHRGSLSLLNRSEYSAVQQDREQLQNVVQPQFTRTLWFTDRDENQALSLRYNGEVLHQEKSPYQTVRVYNTCSYGKMLTIDNMVMCTERDEFHYHEMIVHPALQTHGSPKNVLVIGGGDGGTVREILKYPSVEKVTMVEIDEAVVKASKQFLPGVSCELENPKLKVLFEDGIKFVEDSKEESYDVIIVDGSDPVGPAEGLFSEKFYQNCHRALKPGGVVVAQGESPMFHEKAFVQLNRCLKSVFGTESAHVLLFHATTYPSGMWSLQLASKDGAHPIKSFNKEKAMLFTQEHHLRYYNEDLHSAAFCLPSFVKKMLE